MYTSLTVIVNHDYTSKDIPLVYLLINTILSGVNKIKQLKTQGDYKYNKSKIFDKNNEKKESNIYLEELHKISW